MNENEKTAIVNDFSRASKRFQEFFQRKEWHGKSSLKQLLGH